MVPTAVSQIIEATTKVVIGVGLASFIISRYDDDAWAAVGAITGVSISAGLGTLYLVCYKLRQNRLDKRERAGEDLAAAPRRELLMNLIRFAVPITLGSCFLSLLDFVDSAILMDRPAERGWLRPGRRRGHEGRAGPRQKVLRPARVLRGAHLHQPAAGALRGGGRQGPALRGPHHRHLHAIDPADLHSRQRGHVHFFRSHLPAAAGQQAGHRRPGRLPCWLC